MATLKPGNPERGWNDPPMFSYNIESASQKSPRRNILNKRVGHDLTTLGSKTTGSQKVLTGASPLAGPPLMGPSPGLPPTSQPNPPLSQPGPPSSLPGPPQSLPNVTNEIKEVPSRLNPTSSDEGQNSDFQEDCLLKFKESLKRIEKLVPFKVSEDISRKLLILSDMWENNKLSVAVQKKTLELATALAKPDCNEAHEIHVALMVDHVSEVSQWMVGIKRLIQETRKLPLPQPNDDKHSDEPGNAVSDSNEKDSETT